VNDHRFVEARDLAVLADRLEQALRRAPKALLDDVVTPEAFRQRVERLRAATADVRRAIEELEKLLAP
jgi:uncharacterized membrane protein